MQSRSASRIVSLLLAVLLLAAPCGAAFAASTGDEPVIGAGEDDTYESTSSGKEDDIRVISLDGTPTPTPTPMVLEIEGLTESELEALIAMLTQPPTPSPAPTSQPLDTEGNPVETPQVVEVSIYHNYFDTTYRLYEQSFAYQYFFYTNIANGDITGGTVYIDLPRNIRYILEMNGEPVDGEVDLTAISQPGSYVLKLSVIENETLPVSEQVEYQGIFRFRIMEENLDEQIQEPDIDFDVTVTEPGQTVEPTVDVDPVVDPTVDPTVGDEDEGIIDIDSKLDEMLEPDATEDPSIAFPAYPYTGLKESYDAGKGLFCQTVYDYSFYSSIPNGLITNGSVTFTIPSDLSYKLIKDDTEYTYVSGDAITEEGFYRLTLTEDSVNFIAFAAAPPVFEFRIVARPISDIEVYYLPSGFVCDALYWNDEKLAPDAEEYFLLQRDGSYRIELLYRENPQVKYTVTIEKDTAAPRVSISKVEDEIEILYLSSDISQLQLFKENVEQTSFAGSSVSETGDYTLYVTDTAGNTSIHTFSLSYSMNTGTVLTIVLVVLIIVAVVVFVRIVKRDTSVR